MAEWYENIKDREVGAQRVDAPQPKQRDLSGYIKDIGRAIAQGVSFGTADEIEAFATKLATGKSYSQAVKEIRSEIEQFRTDEPVIAYGAEILSSIPTGIGVGRGLAKMGVQSLAKQAGIEGGLYGFAAGEDTVSDRLTSGLIGGAVGGAVSKSIPVMSAQAQKLRGYGLPMTIGQMAGGGLKTAEEAAQAIPFVGSTIRAGRAKALDAFNEATYNEILAPIGGKLPEGTFGREAYEEARKQIQAEYNDLVPKLAIPSDYNISSKIGEILKSAADEFGDSKEGKQAFDVLNKKINQVLLGRISKDGSITGSELRQAMTAIKNESYDFANDPNVYKQKISRQFSNVADTMSNALIDANPQYAQRLKNVNEAFAKFLPAERAASALGASGGRFTPKQLLSGIKSNDPSLRKRDFARGTARLQEFAETADQVIGSELGKSPTFEKLAVAGMLTGGGGLIGGGIGGSVGLGSTLLAKGLAEPIYSQFGRSLIEKGLGDVAPKVKPTVSRGIAPPSAGILAQELSPAASGLLGVGEARAEPSRYTYEHRIDRLGRPYTIVFDEVTSTATRIDN